MERLCAVITKPSSLTAASECLFLDAIDDPHGSDRRFSSPRCRHRHDRAVQREGNPAGAFALDVDKLPERGGAAGMYRKAKAAWNFIARDERQPEQLLP